VWLVDTQEIIGLTASTLQRAKDLMQTDLEAAVRLQEDLLTRVGHHPRARMAVLIQLVVHKEWSERIKRGETPHHASSVDHLFFRHAHKVLQDLERTSDGVLTADPSDTDARASLAVARFCLGDRASAERIVRSIPSTFAGGFWETVKFKPSFYEELRGFSDADLVDGLPPVLELVSMPDNAKSSLYLSCNYAYFVAFALPMIVSLRDRSPTTPLHLHIMDAPSERTDFILDAMRQLRPPELAITLERPGLERAPTMEARCYYHAVRFIRFYTHLKTCRAPLWLMDVDAIVNRDLGNLMDRLDGHDVALRIRPARLEPWNQFNACVVGANLTPRSLEYFRLIAAYVAYFHKRKSLRWGIDQLAMYGVFVNMEDLGIAPSLRLLNERDIDYDHDDDGFLWPNSGKGKMTHMARIGHPGAPAAVPPANKFDNLFERYWQDVVEIARAAGMKL